MLYDCFSTMFSIQEFTIFPEMFNTKKKREKAAMIKAIMTILGVIIGFVVPTLIISPLAPLTSDPKEYEKISGMYRNNGILIAVLVFVFGAIFFKYGMKEKSTHEDDVEEHVEHVGIWDSLKITFKNRNFVIFIFANMFTWFVMKLLTTIVPLYGIHVLGIGDGDLLLSVLLLVALLSAAAF